MSEIISQSRSRLDLRRRKRGERRRVHASLPARTRQMRSRMLRASQIRQQNFWMCRRSRRAAIPDRLNRLNGLNKLSGRMSPSRIPLFPFFAASSLTSIFSVMCRLRIRRGSGERLRSVSSRCRRSFPEKPGRPATISSSWQAEINGVSSSGASEIIVSAWSIKTAS